MSKRAKGAGATPATRALTAAGIGFTERPYEHDPRADSYGLEAAEALGVEPERVFKTLLAQTDLPRDHGLVVGIVPVTGQLDLKALAAAVGAKKATMADAALAERRYGGVPDEEMLMALSPTYLVKAIAGMKQLSKNGLRYPIAPYGIQNDVRAGMGVSYGKR